MPVVLIIGPKYYNYAEAVRSAFHKAGYTAFIDNYDNPIHPYTGCMKVRYKLSRHREAMQKESRSNYNSYIRERFSSLRPDLVFIMNGEILFPETLDFFRQTSKVALWAFDNIQKIPLAKGHVDHVDAMFCFDHTDAERYCDTGKKAYFLPQACDTEIYKPMDVEKDIDISFVGNMVYSPKRKRLLNAVIDHFPDRKIVVYGLYHPWYKGLFGWLARPHKDIFKNDNIGSAESNVLYNRSRIALNIHQEFQKDGANPRVFEICGTGTYQICDANPYIESIFPNGEIGLYRSEEELLSLIEHALCNDMRDCTESARKIVTERHSFDDRIRTVLEILNEK